MVDRIRYPTVSYLPFYYVFFQFLLLTIFNLQANILTTKDILSNLAGSQDRRRCHASHQAIRHGPPPAYLGGVKRNCLLNLLSSIPQRCLFGRHPNQHPQSVTPPPGHRPGTHKGLPQGEAPTCAQHSGYFLNIGREFEL